MSGCIEILRKVGSETLTTSSGQTVLLTNQLLYVNRKAGSLTIYELTKVYIKCHK